MERYQLYLKHEERMNSNKITKKAGRYHKGGNVLLLVAGGRVVPRPCLETSETTILRIECADVRDQMRARCRCGVGTITLLGSSREEGVGFSDSLQVEKKGGGGGWII